MIKLNIFESNNRIGEIFQSLDIKFAFITKIEDNTYKQLHPAIKCRDFLGDCIWSRATNQNVSIYRFKFAYKESPLDTDKLRLSLKFPSEESKSLFKKNIKFLHTREDLVGVERTKIFTTDKPLTYTIESDSIWQSAVWKMSLFSFYLKVISYKDTTELKNPEDQYFKLLMQGYEEKFLNQIFNTEETLALDIDTAHNTSGFYSIMQNNNKKMNTILLGDK